MSNYRREIVSLYLIDKNTPEEIADKLEINIKYVEKILKPLYQAKRSTGETSLYKVLKELYPMHDIKEQYYFHGQYFDFYIPKLRLVFEYDGVQHFNKVDFFVGKGITGNYNFENSMNMDIKKDKIAKDECIYVIRIGYRESITANNIRSIINEHHQQIIENLECFSKKI